MSKHVLCEDCHAIGSLDANEMLYDHTCPICKGKLLLVHPDDFHLLEYRSDCAHMPDVWNTAYTESRKLSTCVKYAGQFPKVRIIVDKHPCEKCRWFGTFKGKNPEPEERELGGEQKSLEVFNAEN